MFGNVFGRIKNNVASTKCREDMEDSERYEDALTRFNTEMRKLRSSAKRSSDSLLLTNNRPIRTILENQRRPKDHDVYRYMDYNDIQRYSISYDTLIRYKIRKKWNFFKKIKENIYLFSKKNNSQ